MTQWATFAGITGVVLVLLLALSHLTQSALDGTDERVRSDGVAGDQDESSPISGDGTADGNGHQVAEPAEFASVGAERAEFESGDPEFAESDLAGGEIATREEGAALETPTDEAEPSDDARLETELSTGMLLANVALSQGLFAAVLVAAAVYTMIPPAALGVEFSASYLWTGLAVGTAAGLVLYALNEIGSAGATRLGFDHDEELRELLAPDSRGGWLVLLLVVLPLIAFFEEFLFRAALIGALSVGFDVSPWLLAVLSSIAFALGHGVQGPVGIAVTGALGFVLAAVFIYTGSLLVVVVAHYLINALEFVVHEGLGIEWGETTGS